MVEGGAAIKVEKAVESSTETLAVPGEAESGVSNDEPALLNKLKRLKKRSLSSAKRNCWRRGYPGCQGYQGFLTTLEVRGKLRTVMASSLVMVGGIVHGRSRDKHQ